jgi:hypothetical protein
MCGHDIYAGKFGGVREEVIVSLAFESPEVLQFLKSDVLLKSLAVILDVATSVKEVAIGVQIVAYPIIIAECNR